MNIAVLGISGYTGHYLARETTARKHRCIGVARSATRYIDYNAGEGLVLYDANGSDYGQMKEILAKEKVEKVICVYPPDVNHPWTFAADMRSLLQACKDAGVAQLIMMMGGSANNGRWGRNPFAYASFGQQITVGNSYYENIHKARVQTFDEEKEFHWVIFTPNHLIKYPERSGKYIYKTGGQGIWYDEHSQLNTDAGVINYWDFSCAMLDEAENPHPEFKRQLVSLAWDREYAAEITKKIPVMVNK